MKRSVNVLLATLALFLLPGCFSTTDIRTFGDLSEALPGSIRIMTVDTTIYDLERFSFTDTHLEGEGVHLVGGHWIPFSGNLPMSRIVYIQARSFSVLGSLGGLCLAGLTAGWVGEAGSVNGLMVWRPLGGGGSCPYVYAWNGSDYVREGEVFGTALGRGMEASTGCVLPRAADREGVVKIRIADERPETHYINCVRVYACEIPRGTPVCLDTRDRPWALRCPLPPLRAPREIMERDGVRWMSDSLRGRGTYRDVLELTLPRTPGMSEGSLVVHAINTHLFDGAFDAMFRLLGDASLPYLYRMEHDSTTIALLKSWIDECGLRIDVWDGGSWKYAGMIPPEANEVSFSRILRIEAPGPGGDSLRIRLRTLADTWEIDAVEIDWSPALPLREFELPLLRATHNTRGAAEGQVGAPDSAYAVLLPGESIDMAFRSFEPRGGNELAYVCHASGYLYEWLPGRTDADGLPEPFASLNLDRMNVVDYLLAHHDAFLPVLFARWNAMRRPSP